MMKTTSTHFSSNIVSFIEADLGPAVKRSGHWQHWSCPFHNDGRTPSLGVINDRYYCFGCGANGNAVQWLMDYRKMSLAQALKLVKGPAPTLGRIHPKPSVPPIASKTPDTLQAAWKKVIEVCAQQLQLPIGQKALTYLHNRGLQDRTIFSPFHRLGYSRGQTIAGVWVERGIVIPCFSTTPDLEIDYVHYIKVRRPAEDPKYRKLSGQGCDLSGLFGAGWLKGAIAIFLTEGEFDRLLLHQEAGDLVGVATLGGATEHINFARYGHHLLSASHIFVAYDNDTAGEKGASYWQGLSKRVHAVQVPIGKDITEYWQRGGDLAQWVMQILAEYNVTYENDEWYRKGIPGSV